MATETCSLHCGQFSSVSEDTFRKQRTYLKSIFSLVEYDATQGVLNLCSARDVSDMPDELAGILDTLSTLPALEGKGRIMLKCSGVFEICFFRHRMWKLESVGMPADPFEGIRQA